MRIAWAGVPYRDGEARDLADDDLAVIRALRDVKAGALDDDRGLVRVVLNVLGTLVRRLGHRQVVELAAVRHARLSHNGHRAARALLDVLGTARQRLPLTRVAVDGAGPR